MSTQTSDRILFPVADAGHYIGRSRSAIYELLHEGKLWAVRSGGRTLIPREALEAYAASLPEHRIGGDDAA